MHVCGCCWLIACSVCVGAFVRAYLILTLIWTVGSHFFSLIIFLPFLSFDFFFFFFLFSFRLCCACAKSVRVPKV